MISLLPYLSEKASDFCQKLKNLVNKSFLGVHLRLMFNDPREINFFFVVLKTIFQK